jgi:hypothetical protein
MYLLGTSVFLEKNCTVGAITGLPDGRSGVRLLVGATSDRLWGYLKGFFPEDKADGS